MPKSNVEWLTYIAPRAKKLSSGIKLNDGKLVFDGDRVRGPIGDGVLVVVWIFKSNPKEVYVCIVLDKARDPSVETKEHGFWRELAKKGSEFKDKLGISIEQVVIYSGQGIHSLISIPPISATDAITQGKIHACSFCIVCNCVVPINTTWLCVHSLTPHYFCMYHAGQSADQSNSPKCPICEKTLGKGMSSSSGFSFRKSLKKKKSAPVISALDEFEPNNVIVPSNHSAMTAIQQLEGHPQISVPLVAPSSAITLEASQSFSYDNQSGVNGLIAATTVDSTAEIYSSQSAPKSNSKGLFGRNKNKRNIVQEFETPPSMQKQEVQRVNANPSAHMPPPAFQPSSNAPQISATQLPPPAYQQSSTANRNPAPQMPHPDFRPPNYLNPNTSGQVPTRTTQPINIGQQNGIPDMESLLSACYQIEAKESVKKASIAPSSNSHDYSTISGNMKGGRSKNSNFNSLETGPPQHVPAFNTMKPTNHPPPPVIPMNMSAPPSYSGASYPNQADSTARVALLANGEKSPPPSYGLANPTIPVSSKYNGNQVPHVHNTITVLDVATHQQKNPKSLVQNNRNEFTSKSKTTTYQAASEEKVRELEKWLEATEIETNSSDSVQKISSKKDSRSEAERASANSPPMSSVTSSTAISSDDTTCQQSDCVNMEVSDDSLSEPTPRYQEGMDSSEGNIEALTLKQLPQKTSVTESSISNQSGKQHHLTERRLEESNTNTVISTKEGISKSHLIETTSHTSAVAELSTLELVRMEMKLSQKNVGNDRDIQRWPSGLSDMAPPCESGLVSPNQSQRSIALSNLGMSSAEVSPIHSEFKRKGRDGDMKSPEDVLTAEVSDESETPRNSQLGSINSINNSPFEVQPPSIPRGKRKPTHLTLDQKALELPPLPAPTTNSLSKRKAPQPIVKMVGMLIPQTTTVVEMSVTENLSFGQFKMACVAAIGLPTNFKIKLVKVPPELLTNKPEIIAQCKKKRTEVKNILEIDHGDILEIYPDEEELIKRGIRTKGRNKEVVEQKSTKVNAEKLKKALEMEVSKSYASYIQLAQERKAIDESRTQNEIANYFYSSSGIQTDVVIDPKASDAFKQYFGSSSRNIVSDVEGNMEAELHTMADDSAAKVSDVKEKSKLEQRPLPSPKKPRKITRSQSLNNLLNKFENEVEPRLHQPSRAEQNRSEGSAAAASADDPKVMTDKTKNSSKMSDQQPEGAEKKGSDELRDLPPKSSSREGEEEMERRERNRRDYPDSPSRMRRPYPHDNYEYVDDRRMYPDDRRDYYYEDERLYDRPQPSSRKFAGKERRFTDDVSYHIEEDDRRISREPADRYYRDSEYSRGRNPPLHPYDDTRMVPRNRSRNYTHMYHHSLDLDSVDDVEFRHTRRFEQDRVPPAGDRDQLYPSRPKMIPPIRYTDESLSPTDYHPSQRRPARVPPNDEYMDSPPTQGYHSMPPAESRPTEKPYRRVGSGYRDVPAKPRVADSLSPYTAYDEMERNRLPNQRPPTRSEQEKDMISQSPLEIDRVYTYYNGKMNGSYGNESSTYSDMYSEDTRYIRGYDRVDPAYSAVPPRSERNSVDHMYAEAAYRDRRVADDGKKQRYAPVGIVEDDPYIEDDYHHRRTSMPQMVTYDERYPPNEMHRQSLPDGRKERAKQREEYEEARVYSSQHRAPDPYPMSSPPQEQLQYQTRSIPAAPVPALVQWQRHHIQFCDGDFDFPAVTNPRGWAPSYEMNFTRNYTNSGELEDGIGTWSGTGDRGMARIGSQFDPRGSGLSMRGTQYAWLAAGATLFQRLTLEPGEYKVRVILGRPAEELGLGSIIKLATCFTDGGPRQALASKKEIFSVLVEEKRWVKYESKVIVVAGSKPKGVEFEFSCHDSPDILINVKARALIKSVILYSQPPAVDAQFA